MVKRRSRKLLEADQFQARAISLLSVAHADWNEWELEWLLDETRRADDYIYSEKERLVLDRLIACATTFTHYGEWSVQEMLSAAYLYRKDMDEEDEIFLEQLSEWRATDLKVRQISRLARLYRTTEFLPRDETVSQIMRATRKQDSSESLGHATYESSRFA